MVPAPSSDPVDVLSFAIFEDDAVSDPKQLETWTSQHAHGVWKGTYSVNDVLSDLLTTVYGQLRRIAHNLLRGERRDAEVESSVLVHDALLKLFKSGKPFPLEPQQVVSMAVTAMRQQVLDYAKRRNAAKRGGDRQREPLDAWLDRLGSRHGGDALDCLELCDNLEQLDPKLAQLAAFYLFPGPEEIPAAEIASLLGDPLSEVQDRLLFLKAYLRKQLSKKREEVSDAGPGPAAARTPDA
jgi:DNA-directed RNA polymerase specialized sigma24 family protein